MRLLISTFLTMLIIGFAGGSYGQDIHTQKLGDQIYVGEMKNGLFNGEGTLTRTDIGTDENCTYIGEFKDNLFNGQGTSTCGNSTYIGEFKDGLRGGFGTYTDSMGEVMSGTWIKHVLKIPTPPTTSNSEPLVDKKIQDQCLSFGFRVDTDDMANCILQLYLKSEADSEVAATRKAIEEQVKENELQARRLAEQQRQQQEYRIGQVRIQQANLAEQKRQREAEDRKNAARALYKLGMDMANPRRGNSAEPQTSRVINCVISSDPFGQVYTFDGIGCPSGYMPH